MSIESESIGVIERRLAILRGGYEKPEDGELVAFGLVLVAGALSSVSAALDAIREKMPRPDDQARGLGDIEFALTRMAEALGRLGPVR